MLDWRGIPIVPRGGRLAPYLIWAAVRQAYSRTAQVQRSLEGAPMPKPATIADTLEHLAGDLHSIAFDFREPARSHHEAEQRIGEVERIAAAARAAVRGTLAAA